MVKYSLLALALFAAVRSSAQTPTPSPPQPQSAAAQSGAPTPPPDSSARSSAVRAQIAPVIDGREDDAVWRTAVATTDFREFQPTEGKAPRFRTEFKAAYDDRNLYVF